MKEKEQQLFNEWRREREYSSFIADGVQQPLKITFVLKEANWINGNVDLREFLLSDPKRKLLENVEQDCQVVLLPGTSRQKPEYPK